MKLNEEVNRIREIMGLITEGVDQSVIDSILDKISENGIESLSSSDVDKLNEINTYSDSIGNYYLDVLIKKNNPEFIKLVNILLKPTKQPSVIGKNLLNVYLSIRDNGEKVYDIPGRINQGSCLHFAKDLSSFFTKNGIENEIQNPYDGWHAWVYSNGRYYDSTSIDGVKDLDSLLKNSHNPLK